MQRYKPGLICRLLYLDNGLEGRSERLVKLIKPVPGRRGFWQWKPHNFCVERKSPYVDSSKYLEIEPNQGVAYFLKQMAA